MSASDSDWSTGLQIVAAVAVGAAVLGGGLWVMEIGGEFGPAVGGIVGAVIGFVAVSYLMYGR